MNWFDCLLYGGIGFLTIWILKRRLNNPEADENNGEIVERSPTNSPLQVDVKSDIMVTHRRDNDAETDEPHDGSAVSAVVSGIFSKRFDHREVVDEPAHADDGDRGSHEKSVDNDKEIINGNDETTATAAACDSHDSSVVDNANETTATAAAACDSYDSSVVDNADESNEIRDFNLQSTNEYFFEEHSQDSLESKSIADNESLDESSEQEWQLNNVDLLTEGKGEGVQLEDQKEELAENTEDFRSADSGMCTTADVNNYSFDESTNFMIGHRCTTIADDRRDDETDDIEIAAEKDKDTDDGKIINVLDMLRKEYTRESCWSEENTQRTSDLENYCTNDQENKRYISMKYTSDENTESSKITGSSDSCCNDVSDSQSNCSINSAQTWPSTIYGNSSVDDIKFVEDYSDGSFISTTDSDIYNQGFIEPDE